ncbi:hypothetical protein [Kribbella sp. NPDC050470]|uniref:hypothetical protein n=1 Tax=unclassified Kribbella TaxID=2644121 RepID=UPI0037BBC362
MDVAVLLLFAAFLTTAVVTTVSRREVGEVADRLLLLNVAAACGVAALHGCLRGRALAGSDPAAIVAGAAAVCSPESGTGLRPGSPLGSDSDSGERADDGSVGFALAIYSLLVCVISASSLFRGRPARSAIGPREG